MSADNWTICPRCKRNAEATLDKQRFAAGKSYGKVSSDEYLAALKAVEAEAVKVKEMEPSLREDYWIGICLDGRFAVSYSGKCQTCGYSHRFKHEETVTP